jgi:quercetin dioxygenase-like cupin family protein
MLLPHRRWATWLFVTWVSSLLANGQVSPQVPRSNLNVPGSVRRNATAVVPAAHFSHSVLANERVRIFRLELPGSESAPVDTPRHDFLVVSLGKSDFELAGDTVSYPVQMEDGEIQVFKGGWARRIRNQGQTPIRLLEVEVTGNVHPEHPLCGLGAASCSDGHFGSTTEGRYTQSTLFETDTLKLGRIDLSPGGAIPVERFPRPHVLIALRNSQLGDDTAENTGAGEFSLASGDAVWYAPNVVHRLKNLSGSDVELITAEFK